MKNVNGTKTNKFVLGFIIVAVSLLFIYAGGAVFFMSHYFWGTKINENDYSFHSVKQVQNKMIEAADSYELQIKGRNGINDTIKGKEVALEHKFDDSLSGLLDKQNVWLWVVSFFREDQYEVSKTAEFDEDALEERFNALSFLQKENIIEPKDAFIGEYSAQKKQYELVEEEKGSVLDKKKTLGAIRGAMETLDETLDLEEMGCYIDPSVTTESKNIKEAAAKLNRYVNASITYDFVVTTELVDGDQIQQWLEYNGKEVTINQELVREYVNKLSRKYDTYGRNRTFTTTSGKQLELLSGGYGFRTDRAAETEQLIKDIENSEKVIREPTYIYRGYVRGADDIGDTYIEIDLGEQHVYVYNEGKIVLETDCVSGKLSNGNGTPAGVFGITYKERNATLKGENYASDVSYWIPFNGNIGLHDAPWRRSFGGQLYLTQGSHGCINLPADKAAQIYDMVEQNMPVICYY